MTAAGSYDKHASHRDLAAEIQRLAAQASLEWRKAARTLALFGVRDGMSILELGSGPGFITGQLREALPNSLITCLDIDPALLAQAAQHLGDTGGRVQFVEGSVMATGLPENQFDIAYARFLFQHLADPLGAAREALRVLKPGGRLIIHDIDDGLFGVFEPPIPEFDIIIERFGAAQAGRGGDRRIGRKLWRILAAAGFEEIELEVLASHSDTTGVEAFMQQLDPDRLVALVDAGLLASDDLERFRAARMRFIEAPGAYTIWLGLMAGGVKPRPTE
jgi:ubiquinone/menaquinone biosynthesis C-methylase UbiE